jgi:NAD+ synthase
MTDYTALACEIESWITQRVSESGAGGVVLGLSGGVDSGVTAALSARALGNENVLCLALPCGSSQTDTDDSIRLAGFLGIKCRKIDLDPVLASLIRSADLNPADTLAIANVKARLRMTVIYAFSGGKLVAGTSNYSEILVGYWTKWGDGAADILPLGRLWKEEVFALARELDLPDWLIGKIPSAGLWPGQSDEGEMGFSYTDIRHYFQGDFPPGDASDRIAAMKRATDHKRNPIPFFDARKWIGNNE